MPIRRTAAQYHEIRSTFTGRCASASSYLHEGDGRYVPLNILDRPTVVMVYDGLNSWFQNRHRLRPDTTPYGASGAIRHDAAFGTSYVLRGFDIGHAVV
jgi:hypothetical protein